MKTVRQHHELQNETTPHFLQYHDEDTEHTYQVGMNAYFIIDDEEYHRWRDTVADDAHAATCEVCGKHRITARMQMIECDYCIRNFHKRCLKTCPADNTTWQCPVCTGDQEATQDEKSLSEVFCRTEGVIGAGCIQRLYKQGKTINAELGVYKQTQVLYQADASTSCLH